MNKKIMCIGIVILFLFTSFSTISAVKIDDKNSERITGNLTAPFTITLSGFITDSETHDGIDEASIAVAKYPWPPFPDVASTDSNGHYEMEIEMKDLPEDLSICVEKREDYYTAKGSLTISDKSETSYNYDVELEPLPYVLSGRVIDREKQFGIQDAKVSVSVENLFFGGDIYTTNTNANGYYSVKFGARLFTYNFEVTFKKAGYKSESVHRPLDGSTEYNLDCSLLFVGFPPSQPEFISYPEEILRGQEYEVQVSCIDPEEDNVRYKFKWDNTEDETGWYGPYASGETVVMTHIWQEWNDVVEIEAKAKDINGIVGEWSDAIEINMINLGPEIPSKPEGPDKIRINKEYTFSTRSVDPEGDQLYYCFDWDDGTEVKWLGPYNSDVTIEATHTWTVKSEDGYSIKVKTIDDPSGKGDFEEYGIESDWSDPLIVSKPKIRPINNHYFNDKISMFFEKISIFLPILQDLLNL